MFATTMVKRRLLITLFFVLLLANAMLAMGDKKFLKGFILGMMFSGQKNMGGGGGGGGGYHHVAPIYVPKINYDQFYEDLEKYDPYMVRKPPSTTQSHQDDNHYDDVQYDQAEGEPPEQKPKKQQQQQPEHSEPQMSSSGSSSRPHWTRPTVNWDHFHDQLVDYLTT